MWQIKTFTAMWLWVFRRVVLSSVSESFTQCYLQHCQPDPLQRFVRIHLDLSRVGEHLQLRHPGAGFEGALGSEGEDEGNNDGTFAFTRHLLPT